MNPKLHSVLTINGERRDVLAPASATLLDALRSVLGLTGTKRGCNHGVCGACTVLLDGKLARACLTLAADVGERAVVTIEGIGGNGGLSPVQRALVEHGAIQCGFCTPGVVIALSELFARDPRPDRGAIRGALSGNLCRCSGYAKIVEAAERLAGEAR
ncbi:MAG: (2Fe-2S)-binding protein [Burkholderiales bacterium]|nr:(2Fe-2S)-binding protein [Burkholderiales bacterium]